MPRSIRLETKRRLDYARKHTATINYYLELIENLYREQHPEIAEPVNVARHLNAELDTLIERINESI